MPPTLVRPGIVLKQVLSGLLPIEGYFVSRASITQLHRAYKDEVRKGRSGILSREKRSKQRGMTYDSFKSLVRKAMYLGFLEAVEPDGSEAPPPRGMIRGQSGTLQRTEGMGDNAEIIQSKPTYYRLTQKGLSEEEAWFSLATAYADLIFLKQRQQK